MVNDLELNSDNAENGIYRLYGKERHGELIAEFIKVDVPTKVFLYLSEINGIWIPSYRVASLFCGWQLSKEFFSESMAFWFACPKLFAHNESLYREDALLSEAKAIEDVASYIDFSFEKKKERARIFEKNESCSEE
jgi:hypothetical protein